MISFTEEQKKILEYSDGTMSISAVPGAGKTFITTHLVLKLLKSSEKSRILILAYMNSAVNNFKNRLNKMIDEEGLDESLKNRFEVMTIHSLATMIIKENPECVGIDEDFMIIDDFRRAATLEYLIQKHKYDESGNNTKMYNILNNMIDPSAIEKSKKKNNIRDNLDKTIFDMVTSVLSKIKSYGITLYEFEARLKKGLVNIIFPIIKDYDDYLKENGLIDYDDILNLAFRLLESDEEVRNKFNQRYSVVFEDECQDSNEIQSDILSILTEKTGNLIRVGDINQSITGSFTSSSPKNFRDFINRSDKKMEMTVSGRSSDVIINAANKFLYDVSHDPDFSSISDGVLHTYIKSAKDADISMKNPPSEDSFIEKRAFENEQRELRFTVDMVKKYMDKYPEDTVGILTRNRFYLSDLSMILDESGVEHYNLGEVSAIKKKSVKKFGKILEFLNSPGDLDILIDSFLASESNLFDVFYLTRSKKYFDAELNKEIGNAFNKFFDFEGSDMSESFEYIGSKLKAIYDVQKPNVKNGNNIEFSKEHFSKMTIISMRNMKKAFNIQCLPIDEMILEMADFLCEDDFDRMLMEYFSKYINFRMSFEEDFNVDDVRDIARLNGRDPFGFILNFLSELDGYEPEKGSLTISTYHKSKGLEWDFVVMTGLTERNFPTEMKSLRTKYFLKDRYSRPLDIAFREISNAMGEDAENKKIEELSETARLFYVAITRAKKRIFMLWSKKNKFKFENNKSKFVDLVDVVKLSRKI